MTPAEGASIIGVILVALGLIATWVKNGKAQSEAQGSMENRIKNIEKMLDNPSTGLSAIKGSIDEQRLHCTKISTEYGERIKILEKS